MAGRTWRARALSTALAALLWLMAWGFAGVNTAARAATTTISADIDARYIVVSGDAVFDGVTITRTGDNGDPFITVKSGASVTFTNCVAYGLSGASGPLMLIESGATVTLNDTVLRDNSHLNGNAGGVHIKNGGSLIMTGTSRIENCSAYGGNYSGGGVFVQSGGSLRMAGTSRIENCSAYAGGGVYVEYGGSVSDAGIFTMESGTAISGCSAVYGGGVSNSGIFTMESGAVISGCSATLLGGGVTNNGKFSTAGVISGRAARGAGAVFHTPSRAYSELAFSGGARIGGFDAAANRCQGLAMYDDDNYGVAALILNGLSAGAAIYIEGCYDYLTGNRDDNVTLRYAPGEPVEVMFQDETPLALIADPADPTGRTHTFPLPAGYAIVCHPSRTPAQSTQIKPPSRPAIGGNGVPAAGGVGEKPFAYLSCADGRITAYLNNDPSGYARLLIAGARPYGAAGGNAVSKFTLCFPLPMAQSVVDGLLALGAERVTIDGEPYLVLIYG